MRPRSRKRTWAWIVGGICVGAVVAVALNVLAGVAP